MTVTINVSLAWMSNGDADPLIYFSVRGSSEWALEFVSATGIRPGVPVWNWTQQPGVCTSGRDDGTRPLFL